jgi:hypothetical protein
MLMPDGPRRDLGCRREPDKIYLHVSRGHHIGLKRQPKLSQILSELLVCLMQCTALSELGIVMKKVHNYSIFKMRLPFSTEGALLKQMNILVKHLSRFPSKIPD